MFKNCIFGVNCAIIHLGVQNGAQRSIIGLANILAILLSCVDKSMHMKCVYRTATAHNTRLVVCARKNYPT